MRRAELILVVSAALAFLLVALLARAPTRADELLDPRRSTHLSGPQGAQGLAGALEKLGVPVEQRQRPWFGLGADTSSIEPAALIALLDVSFPLTAVEDRGLIGYARRGGALFLAGTNGVERCLGVRVVSLLVEPGADSLPVESSSLVGSVPATQALLQWMPRDSLLGDPEWEERGCTLIHVVGADTLLRTTDGRAAAWRLQLLNGGRVIMVADARYVSNRVLKESDTGVLVLSWMLDRRPTRVIVDEYHQGFGEGGSVVLAAWRWARSSPGGWAMLQLVFAGLVALAASAVRFGPALHVVERRRRSPIEHLDALAVGLGRAEAGDTAVGLLVNGLRRRLRRKGRLRQTQDDLQPWLASLDLAAQTADAHRAVKRLGALLRERGGEQRVLAVGLAVEDVWEALAHEKRYEKS